jgi:ribosome-associated heat shock protein Hsp15
LIDQFQRLDVRLDVACLFKCRWEAQTACSGGKVDVNGVTAKPHRNVRAGDSIVISRPFGRKQTVTVRSLAEKHVPKTDARTLYEDTTPLLTAEEIALRRLERQWRASSRPIRTPNKRERRALRKLKEQD